MNDTSVWAYATNVSCGLMAITLAFQADNQANNGFESHHRQGNIKIVNS